ncbi:TPA: thioredoxin [Citrobacter koseri]|uniref:thioredoxin family protein n=1 Tax=Citrobacter koseri TaxID=545 RepID=UPI00190171E5|nr:thioredoxin domain-containing protein [Citrobacter koseri]MBJ8987273.1 thioredoxin [Citrobacter koseri]HEM7934613.1 thioredoxin [Citrobacter koseri]
MNAEKIFLYDEDNFAEIERYDGVAMVRFYADWCKPCHDSEPFFDTAALQLGDNIKVGKVNTLLAPVLTAKYGIWGVPNVLVFKKGQVVKHLTGPQSASMLINALSPYLSDAI